VGAEEIPHPLPRLNWAVKIEGREALVFGCISSALMKASSLRASTYSSQSTGAHGFGALRPGAAWPCRA
jgi:hypothetical protein